jgi:hypothetical protein
MAKHASKAAITGVETTVRPLMLLRAGVSELPQKYNSTAPWVVPCENDATGPSAVPTTWTKVYMSKQNRLFLYFTDLPANDTANE